MGLSKPDSEYDKAILSRKGLNNFREDFYSDNIESRCFKKWDFSHFEIKR